MICDKIENAQQYAGLSPRLAGALEVLGNRELIHRVDGRYEIDGDKLVCLVQRYRTRPAQECNLEAHKKHIDVQLIVSGEEIIRHAHTEDLEVRQPYDEASDKTLYLPHEKMSQARLGSGMFGIFFPHDAHMPCLQADGPAEVHKVVVKVRIGN